MKSSTKERVVKVLDKIATILKCGGPGGTPGPCPEGTHHSGMEERQYKGHQKSKDALNQSSSTNHSAAKELAWKAKQAANNAASAGLRAEWSNAKVFHKKAVEYHKEAAAIHKGEVSKAGKTKEGHAHDLARIQHEQAAKMHFEISRDIG